MFIALAMSCAPEVHPLTAMGIASVESSLNPWSIGVVGGALERQPLNRNEAVATARALHSAGWNFSVGLGQINVGNWPRLGLTYDNAFEPCTNLGAMQSVLVECFERAQATGSGLQARQGQLRRALSCYYSGNFTTGFQHGYVRKVVATTLSASQPVPPAPPKEKT
jgi:type IV secretion system protein VirB1